MTEPAFHARPEAALDSHPAAARPATESAVRAGAAHPVADPGSERSFLVRTTASAGTVASVRQVRDPIAVRARAAA